MQQSSPSTPPQAKIEVRCFGLFLFSHVSCLQFAPSPSTPNVDHVGQRKCAAAREKLEKDLEDYQKKLKEWSDKQNALRRDWNKKIDDGEHDKKYKFGVFVQLEERLKLFKKRVLELYDECGPALRKLTIGSVLTSFDEITVILCEYSNELWTKCEILFKDMRSAQLGLAIQESMFSLAEAELKELTEQGKVKNVHELEVPPDIRDDLLDSTSPLACLVCWEREPTHGYLHESDVHFGVCSDCSDDVNHGAVCPVCNRGCTIIQVFVQKVK